MMKPLFIDIEGLHGVGKSETIGLLADALNAVHIATVPEELATARKIFDESSSIDARYCFFLSAVLGASENIRKRISEGRTVVVESYLYRTIAFHKGMGSTLEVKLPPSVIVPDLVIHLVCSPQQRAARLAKRNRASHGRYDMLAEKHQLRILEEYRKFDMVEIDTSNLGQLEVVEVIKNIAYELVYDKLLG